jgi:hypothetical protein
MSILRDHEGLWLFGVPNLGVIAPFAKAGGVNRTRRPTECGATRQYYDDGCAAASRKIVHGPRYGDGVCFVTRRLRFPRRGARFRCFDLAKTRFSLPLWRRSLFVQRLSKESRSDAPRSWRSAHCSGIPALRRPSYDRSLISMKRGSTPCLGARDMRCVLHDATVLNDAAEGAR